MINNYQKVNKLQKWCGLKTSWLKSWACRILEKRKRDGSRKKKWDQPTENQAITSHTDHLLHQHALL